VALVVGSPAVPISAEEARVLGCLLEKERTTPDAYPLSMNALVAACNQSTNRAPVVQYDETTVEGALDQLRERGLVRRGVYPGSRVIKYRHTVDEELKLGPDETALLCVLLLRGPQTPGELKSRTERLHAFTGLTEVEDALDRLAGREEPLARRLGREPGQKEARVRELLTGADVPVPEVAEEAAPAISASRDLTKRVAALEAEVAALRAEVERLRDALGG
jgi:uncharacterized protein YceH (UPF0502 family)